MNKKIKWSMSLVLAAVILIFLIWHFAQQNNSEQNLVPDKPIRGDINLTISTVGTVKPQNRLEIKPPFSGRVEEILVKEGQEVKAGDILVLMSSTERATLMDAARLQGKEEFAYWQRIYKETPLVAPIDGIVIVRDVEPGQTITTNEAILVLSNRLIVEADMDETDIGEIKEGQKAIIGLDAYPDLKIDAVVDHISYESNVVNNVTIYKVDILPTEVPEVFRSGMSASVEVVIKEVQGALLIPFGALIRENNQALVLVKDSATRQIKKVPVIVGLENNGYVEIISGLAENNVILVKKDLYVAPKDDNGSTPFLPSFKNRKDQNQK
ncbi:MAG: efflux RND transporter periplasmic adaptor subunit [Pseudomonadota bacterium]